MSNAPLSLWFLLAQIIFTPDMNLDKRLERLQAHFNPQVGQTITVDPFEKNNRHGKDPLDLRGYVDVTPPPGQCFLLRKKGELPDVRICKKTRVSYSLNELTLAGTIEWMLYVDDRDVGTPLIWPTPYRLAQIMPTGQNLQYGHYTPIESCTVSPEKGERQIILVLMDGNRIHIQFPETDKLVNPQPDPEPNLYFNTKRKHGLQIDQSKVAASKKAAAGEKEKKEGKKGKKKAEVSDEDTEAEEADVDEAGNPTAGGKDVKKEESGGGSGSGDMRNSNLWTRTEQKKQLSQWVLTARDAFEMSAGLVSSDGGPRGFQGKCRYRLKDAPGDPPSGVIECLPTDSFTHFIAHLSCASGLPPSKK